MTLSYFFDLINESPVSNPNKNLNKQQINRSPTIIYFKMVLMIHAVDGNTISGVIVATIMASISLGEHLFSQINLQWL